MKVKLFMTVLTLSCVNLVMGCSQSINLSAPLNIKPSISLIQTHSYTGIYQIARKMFHDTFASKDLNQDGYLTPVESGLDSQAFEELDKNKDQKLSESEMFSPRMYADFIQAIRDIARDELKDYDKNQDSQLDYPEFKPYGSHHSTNVDGLFKETDKNNNGTLNISEFEDFVAKIFAGQTTEKLLSQLRHR